jgi:uncharacterized protein YcgL (UPF0745 family)
VHDSEILKLITILKKHELLERFCAVAQESSKGKRGYTYVIKSEDFDEKDFREYKEGRYL